MDGAQFLADFFETFKPDLKKPIVIGVSGGADSLCLVHLLLQSDLELVAAHFDHQLRPVSAQQAKEVISRMQNWGL